MVEPLLKVTTMVSKLQDKLDDKPYFHLKPWLSLLAKSQPWLLVSISS